MKKWTPAPLRAFTLIELLIVVAIIAILAAIAVPNFLEAQVRAKVSRAKSDMRTIVTGLESYYVDNNHFPDVPYSTLPISPLTGSPSKLSTAYSRIGLAKLTSPISYLTNSKMEDPFAKPGEDPLNPQNTDYFGYANATAGPEAMFLGELGALTGGFAMASNIGAFREHGFVLQSVGPDQLNYAYQMPVTGQGFVFAYAMLVDPTSPQGQMGQNFIYDPTNGTVSTGDIVKTRQLNFNN